MRCLLFLLGSFLVAAAWETDCGRSKFSDAGREQRLWIVGGWEAREGEFSWQASLQRNGRHFCGAVLINRNWALTAAHCTEDENVNDLNVMLGGHLQSRSRPGEVSIDVDEYYEHPDYDTDDISDDIALLRLASPVTFTADIQPACRPTGGQYTGNAGTASGWGTLWSDGPSPDELRYTNIPILPDQDCNLAFPGEIFPGMMCAGYLGGNDRDTCQGDSGGPLAVNRNGRFHIVGLVSWGRGCAGATPGVYARVSHYLGWIDSIISNYEKKHA